MNTTAKQRAEDHWDHYVGPMQHTMLMQMVEMCMAISRFHYVTSHVHGVKHAEQDARETARAAFTPVQEGKNGSEPISCGTCGHNGYGCTPDALVAGCHNWARKAEGAATFPFTFPPALKWMGKEGREYVEKLLEEVNEVGETNVDDPRSTMMEAFDVVHVAETMIRTIAKETGIDPAEVAGEVVAKNSKRNYYQG